ncbi:MAG: Dna2/Cas4 domain-containing protein [Phaeodactylibacter sp.]|nr:Dna2/Cas4 domain-containing protein [Phaeodactylibacter sp.]
MTHKKYYPPLLPGRFFHIFNRGNNGDNLFYQERNYAYFLRKYFAYLSPVLDTYCYSLLPNHFHILARVKEEDVVIGHKRDAIPGPRDTQRRDGIPGQGREKEAALWVSELFRRFFLGYSQAIRKQEGRTSSLFQKNFKRLEVDSESYLINLVLYIHANSQLHGLCSDFREYGHSSYDIFSHALETPIRRSEVLEWFGSSYPAFVQAHLERVNLNVIDPVIIEEDLFDPKTKNVHETKKSDKMEGAHVAQVKYYLYVLYRHGVEGARGLIEYPRLRERTQVAFDPEADVKEIESWLADIRRILDQEQCPPVLDKPVCKRCSYYDYCYSGED